MCATRNRLLHQSRPVLRAVVPTRVPWISNKNNPSARKSTWHIKCRIRSTWLNHTLRPPGAAFYVDYDDIQITARTCPKFDPAPSCAAPLDESEVVGEGQELTPGHQPVRALRIDASAFFRLFLSLSNWRLPLSYALLAA